MLNYSWDGEAMQFSGLTYCSWLDGDGSCLDEDLGGFRGLGDGLCLDGEAPRGGARKEDRRGESL